MSYITKLSLDGATPIAIGSSLFGVCATGASTAAKVVTLSSFDTLIDGVTIHVQFTYGNTASNLTLQVGSTLAKNISNPGGSYEWAAGAMISFTYDGTQWMVNDGITTDISIVDTYDSTSSAGISGKGVAAALNTLGDAAEKDLVTSLTDSTTSTDVPTAAAVASYVAEKTAGITGAMRFKGPTTTTMSDGLTTATVTIGGSSYTPDPGDVVLSGDHQEYVWVETNTTTHAGYWELLGDEGSYALKTSTDTITEVASFTANTLPQLTVTQTDTSKVTVTNGSAASLTTNSVSIPNVTSAGTATTASVAAGVLNITLGSAPTIAATPITVTEVDVFTANTPTAVSVQDVSVGSASGWNAGTQASLTTNDTTVVVP